MEKFFVLPLKKGEIFKENQQLKETMENSPKWLISNDYILIPNCFF